MPEIIQLIWEGRGLSANAGAEPAGSRHYYNTFQCPASDSVRQAIRRHGSYFPSSAACPRRQAPRLKRNQSSSVGDRSRSCRCTWRHTPERFDGYFDAGLRQSAAVSTPLAGSSPLLGVSVTRMEQPLATEACAAFNSNAVRRIADDENVKLIVLAALWDNPVDLYVGHPAGANSAANGLELLRSGLMRSIEALKRPGVEIVILGDTPYFTVDPYRIALADSLPQRRALFCLVRSDCSVLFTGSIGQQYLRNHSTVAEAVPTVALRASVTHFDLMSSFCGATSCLFRQDDRLFFLDTNHVSKLGASVALRDLPLPR